jgi:heme/copper-type cytochrome/quinol oxidase subunit 2
MFLYQLGLTLGKEVREETVSLVLTIITGLVIVFSVLMLFKKQEKDNAKEIEKTYQEENRDMLLTPSVSLSPKK